MIQMQPYPASQLTRDRQRDVLAQAERQRTGSGQARLGRVDKIAKSYSKVVHVGLSFPAMRRAVSLICALTVALLIGLVGTGTAQAVSRGPNVTLSLTTADCSYPGQLAVHYGFYPADGRSYYVSIKVWMYNFSTGRWSSFPWSQPASVSPSQNLNLHFRSIPSGAYYLLTEWKQYQANGWSQSIYDKVDQVFNYMPNGFSSNTESACAL